MVGGEKDKREQILDTASKCIVKYGLQKTNAQLIADELKISQTTVFYYFPKQHILFDSLFDFIVGVGREFVTGPMAKAKKPLTYKEKLIYYYQGQLRWAEQYPHHSGVMLFSLLESTHNKKIQKKVITALEHGVETIFSYIAGGIVEKQFKPNMEPRPAAQLIHKTIIGCTTDIYLKNGAIKASDYEPLLYQLINFILSS